MQRVTRVLECVQQRRDPGGEQVRVEFRLRGNLIELTPVSGTERLGLHALALVTLLALRSKLWPGQDGLARRQQVGGQIFRKRTNALDQGSADSLVGPVAERRQVGGDLAVSLPGVEAHLPIAAAFDEAVERVVVL